MQKDTKISITISIVVFFIILYAGSVRFFHHVDIPVAPKETSQTPSYTHNEPSSKQDVGPAIADPTKG